jgi:hypothetical protein
MKNMPSEEPIMTTGRITPEGNFYDGVFSAQFKWKLVSCYRRQAVSPVGTAILVIVWIVLEVIRNG